MKVFFYFTYYNLLSRFILFYYVIVLIINLYYYFDYNNFLDLLNFKLNVNDTNFESNGLEALFLEELEFPNFDQYTIKDVDNILAKGNLKNNITLEQKFGIPYFWLRLGSDKTYEIFKEELWKKDKGIRGAQTRNIKNVINKIIELHDGNKEEALPDIIKTLKFNVPNYKFVGGTLYGPKVTYEVIKFVFELSKFNNI